MGRLLDFRGFQKEREILRLGVLGRYGEALGDSMGELVVACFQIPTICFNDASGGLARPGEKTESFTVCPPHF